MDIIIATIANEVAKKTNDKLECHKKAEESAIDIIKNDLHNSKEDNTVEFTMIQKIKDQQQVQYALQSIIEELE